MAANNDVWTRFSADPRVDTTAAMRAGDADRAVAHDVLGGAYAEGRLDLAEFDERTGQVIESRTLGELLEPLRDLVSSASSPVTRGSAHTDLHSKAVDRYRRDLRDARNGWVFVSGICVAVWAVTSIVSGGPLFFWPIFPALGVGIGWFSVRMTAESRIEGYEAKIAETRRIRRDDRDD